MSHPSSTRGGDFGELEPVPTLLQRRAREHPDELAFTWRGEAWSRERCDVARGARRGALAAAGLQRGDRLLVALSSGPDVLSTLLAAQDLGILPIPLASRSSAARLDQTARRFGCSGVLAELSPPASCKLSSASSSPRWLDPSSLPAGPDPGPQEPDPSSPAFVQPTSGTTGDPKGVVLSHAALRINAEQLTRGLGLRPDDIFYSWLPLHHDMGLVLMAVVPLILGARLHLHPPDGRSLRDWMPGIAATGSTITAGPDFAYRLALRLTRAPQSLDLARLRLALDAAEPVRASTIERFESAFGLDRVVVPGYGLAEATVGVSARRPGSLLPVDEHGNVGVGSGFPGVDIAIVDAAGELQPPGVPGEIVLRTPARCLGYLDDPEATAELMRGGRLHTGDLGRLDADGELFVVDRLKDVILMGGETLAPRELEEIAGTLPWIRRADAVGIDRGRLEGEQAYVFAELDPGVLRSGTPLDELATELIACLRAALGQRAGRVVLVRVGTLPRTPNGKAMRRELRDAWRSGDLQASGSVLWPPTVVA